MKIKKLVYFYFADISYDLPVDFRGERYVERKFSKGLGLQRVSEAWNLSLKQTGNGTIIFQGTNLTTRTERNCENVGAAVEKPTS